MLMIISWGFIPSDFVFTLIVFSWGFIPSDFGFTILVFSCLTNISPFLAEKDLS